MGGITWLVSTTLIEIGGASREMTEGIAAITAALVLFYVGFWLHNKTSARQWQHFIESSIKKALSKGTLWGLAGLSFIAVYREVFETVLFYQALWIQTDGAGQDMIFYGLLTGSAVLLVLAWLIDPVQAGLLWSISKSRRSDGERPGGFPGADVIFDRIENKPALRRVGLSVEGKRPVRDGQMVLDENGEQVGEICSAGYGASVGRPIAMAYIKRELGEPGTALSVDVRGKSVPVTVTKMPFTPQRYYRG